MDSHNELAKQFESIFEHLLAGEKIDLYEKNLSFLFETIAESLIKNLAFDGAVNLTAKIRKSKQIVVEGEMWIFGEDARKQWKESFQVVVTDKRITKQGIWIKIRVGTNIGEGSLSEVFAA